MRGNRKKEERGEMVEEKQEEDNEGRKEGRERKGV